MGEIEGEKVPCRLPVNNSTGAKARSTPAALIDPKQRSGRSLSNAIRRPSVTIPVAVYVGNLSASGTQSTTRSSSSVCQRRRPQGRGYEISPDGPRFTVHARNYVYNCKESSLRFGVHRQFRRVFPEGQKRYNPCLQTRARAAGSHPVMTSSRGRHEIPRAGLEEFGAKVSAASADTAQREQYAAHS